MQEFFIFNTQLNDNEKITIFILFTISTFVVFSQEPSLRLKAFNRFTKNDVNTSKIGNIVIGEKPNQRLILMSRNILFI